MKRKTSKNSTSTTSSIEERWARERRNKNIVWILFLVLMFILILNGALGSDGPACGGMTTAC